MGDMNDGVEGNLKGERKTVCRREIVCSAEVFTMEC